MLRIAGGFPDLSLQLQNGMFDSHVATGDELFTQLPRRPFLVDSAFEEPVPVMEYTSSFPFAYIPRLHALALEFPLDVSANLLNLEGGGISRFV